MVALVLAMRLVPAHVNEATDPVDNLGGILSVALVASLILAINFAPVPERGDAGRSGWRRSPSRRRSRSSSGSAERRTPCTTSTSPAVASSGSRRAGIIVFGSLMGAMFIGQQFLQNVLGYDTLEAGTRSCRLPRSW